MDADCPAASLVTCKRTYGRNTATFVDQIHRRQNLRLAPATDNTQAFAVGRHDPNAPHPVQYTRPMLSTFKPSGMPGSESSFRSAKMLRPTMLPPASSLIAWMYCDERVFATYLVRSSGDSASPFGYSQCASTLKVPSGLKR
jgi:hypothetical protein